MQRKIIHIDMDAFYASVEQRDNPALRGRPVAVGYDGPRGVVATASYEARPFGVHSAQAVSVAKRLCPGLIVVPARFDVYKSVSAQIREIFHSYTDLVEPLSLDEAFLDVSHHPSATIVAREIKARIKATTGLNASAGVSVNKMLAKIASDYDKPDGLFVVEPKMIPAFVSALQVDRFFGVGKVTAEKMHRLGIFTGADLSSRSEGELVKHFGKSGHDYYLYARGIDNRLVQPYRERKSVGAEQTFESDTDNPSQLRQYLAEVREDVVRRIDKAGFRGKTLTLKIRFDDFRQITRSRTVADYLITDSRIAPLSQAILDDTDLGGHKVRLIGLTVSAASSPSASSRDPWLFTDLSGTEGIQLRLDL